MSGDKWVQRVADQAKAAGQGTSVQAIRPLSVEGVGSGSSKADSKATIPVCLADGRIDKFETIVCSNSELPGLYGLNGLTANAGVIDTGNDRLIFPGPAGIKYTLPPGSKVYKLERAVSGHLILPVCDWTRAKAQLDSAGGKSLF